MLKIWMLASVLLMGTSAMAEQKYLIEFGWDEPTVSFMKSHLAEMEKTPFDGVVYHIEYTKEDGSPGRFMNECWGSHAFNDRELKRVEEELRSLRFTTLKQNFLRFNVIPGDVDWFSDYAPIVNNARQSARLAAAGQSAGVLFDIEQYGFPLFTYPKQKLAGSKSFDEYAKQAHQRGAEVMNGFQQGWRTTQNKKPLVILLTYGCSLPHQETEGDRKKLADVRYGLLQPFLEGMYAAADESTQIVDGFEFAYAYKTEADFKDARDLVFERVQKFVTDPKTYRAHTSLSFGLWMDYNWRKNGWDVSDVTKNYFTPKQFAASLRLAMQYSDRYVWIYTESPRWWTATGVSEKLPNAYDAAIRKAIGAQ